MKLFKHDADMSLEKKRWWNMFEADYFLSGNNVS